MNSSVSIYHKTTSNQLYEYPVDTPNPIKAYLANHTLHRNSSLITARKNNLMYYAYDLRLTDSDHFGIIICMNGVYVTNLQYLKDLFEEAIYKMLALGILDYSHSCISINDLIINPSTAKINHFNLTLNETVNRELSILNKTTIIEQIRSLIEELPYEILPPKDYKNAVERIKINITTPLGLSNTMVDEMRLIEATISHELITIGLPSLFKTQEAYDNFEIKEGNNKDGNQAEKPVDTFGTWGAVEVFVVVIVVMFILILTFTTVMISH